MEAHGFQGPWFATRDPRGLGVTGYLSQAARFPSEALAEQALANEFGAAMRECGAVVELAQ